MPSAMSKKSDKPEVAKSLTQALTELYRDLSMLIILQLTPDLVNLTHGASLITVSKVV